MLVWVIAQSGVFIGYSIRDEKPPVWQRLKLLISTTFRHGARA